MSGRDRLRVKAERELERERWGKRE